MQPDTAQPPPAAIELRVNDGIATLLLNRPQARNAIDDAMRAELVAMLDRIAREDAIRAVVVTG
jgi:enoyl-CoA hydratase/carnithine racemase